MQFYFGRVAAEATNFDLTPYFTSKDNSGNKIQFWYGVEFGSGPEGRCGITIYDTINRAIPIDIDSVPELILALQDVLDFQEQVEASLQFIKQVEDKSFVHPQEVE